MTISKLSQPEYLHILINHLPIIGLMVVTVLLAAFMLLRNRSAVTVAMIAVSLLALSAWPVLVTGQNAYKSIDQIADEPGKAYLDQHMELAEFWIYLYFATFLVAGAGTVVAQKKPPMLYPAATITLIFAIGCLIAGSIIAKNGGQIRHPEFRAGPVPAADHEHTH